MKRRPLSWQRRLIGFLLLLNALPFSYGTYLPAVGGVVFLLAGLLVLFLPNINLEDNADNNEPMPASQIEHIETAGTVLIENESQVITEPKELDSIPTGDKIVHYFKVAGVTFRNPDGTSRQKILKEICMDDDFGIEDAYLEEYKYKGEDAIRVLTNYGCVGNIKREDIEEVKPLFDLEIERCYIDIDSFENDNGKKIYYAEVNIIPVQ